MKTKFFYIIDNNKGSAAFNMAADLFLKQKAEKNNFIFLRFYGFINPTVTYGKFQKIDKTIIEKYKKNNIDCVRRMTGGRAVFHDFDLTYSFSAPLSFFSDPTLKGVYKTIAVPFKKTLINNGIKADIYSKECKDYKSKFLCFGSVSLYEICAEGKKLLGSAQYRTERSVLQHGSMYGKRSLLCPGDFKEMYQNIYINDLFLKEEFKFMLVKEFSIKLNLDYEIYNYSENDLKEISILEKSFLI